MLNPANLLNGPGVASGRRRYRRARIRLVVGVKGDTGELVPALLTDLSCNGFRLEQLRGDVGRGPVWLHIKGAEPLEARVIWSEGATLGCQLITPLPE